MNDKELRDKIADTLNATAISVELEKEDIYTFADALISEEIGDVSELQKECESKEKSYNACYSDYKYWKDKAEEYKHRAEVAERALCDMCEEYEDNFKCDLYKECESDKPCYLCDYTQRLQKSERELQEEKKND